MDEVAFVSLCLPYDSIFLSTINVLEELEEYGSL